MEEKEELLNQAIQKVMAGGDTKLKLAIWDLDKAIEVGYSYDKRDDWEVLNRKLKIIKCFVEIFSGLENSKKVLINHLLEQASCRVGKEETYVSLNSVKSGDFSDVVNELIIEELPNFWLKSLKYDAILKELENYQTEEIKDKSQLERIKSIIGNSER